MTDLLVRGGTVVTAAGSRRADVAIAGWLDRARSRPTSSGLAASAAEVIDATGLLVLPGRGRRPHAHARRHRRRAGSVLPGLGRRGLRRDDDVPRVQQPGHGLVAAGRTLAARRPAGVARRDRGRLRDRLRRLAGDLRADGRPCRGAAGDGRRRACRRRRRSWSSTSDSTTAASSMPCASSAAGAGCSRSTARIPVLIDSAVADALARGDTAPRFHAATRSTEAEEVATHRVMAFARAADVPVHVVHLSSRGGARARSRREGTWRARRTPRRARTTSR